MITDVIYVFNSLFLFKTEIIFNPLLIHNSKFIIMITNVSVNIIHIFRSLWVLLAKRKTTCF